MDRVSEVFQGWTIAVKQVWTTWDRGTEVRGTPQFKVTPQVSLAERTAGSRTGGTVRRIWHQETDAVFMS
jgi:hypothetical protein